MTRNIHTMTSMTTPATGPAATDALADQAAIRELFAARAELASLGATTSPSRLERALERLQAAQRPRSERSLRPPDRQAPPGSGSEVPQG